MTATSAGEGRPLPRLQGLDTLRVTAIVAVILYHVSVIGASGRVLGILGKFGYFGVDLFFVLSGFLIAGQYFAKIVAKRPAPLSSFYLRRFVRTLPNYFVVFGLTYAFVVGYLGSPWPSPWRYFVFAQNFVMPVSSFAISWSLCVEEHFYLIFPLVAAALVSARSARLAVLVAAVILLGEPLVRALIWFRVQPLDLAQTTYWTSIYYPTYLRLDGLTFGVCLAALYRLRPLLWARVDKHSGWLLTFGVVLCLAAFAVSWHQEALLACSLGFWLFAAGSTLLVASTLNKRSLLARLRIPGVPTIALLSYAMYLTHLPAIHAGIAIASRLGIGSRLVVLVIQLGLMVLFAWALYFAVEMPMMRLRDRWFRAHQGPVRSA